MKRLMRVIAAAALVPLLSLAAHAAGFSVGTFTSGVLGSEPAVKSGLIKDGRELAKAKEALGITAPLPGADFGKEALLLIVSPDGKGGIIELTGVAPAHGALEVRYRVNSEGPPPEGGPHASYPYLIASLSPAPGKDVPVRFIDEDYLSSLASDTGLGQIREYTNVLSGGEGSRLTEYLPLDKGNTWTYEAVKGGESSEVTNTVVSETDGWSVYDTFFGIPGVGMKITPGGEVFVASKGGIKTFYNKDVVSEFKKEPVKTPAGEFGDVMVVTMSEGGGFWFRDVYARGVGLIAHEQNSGKGRVSYTLVRAVVDGIEYPRTARGRSAE